MSYENVKSFFEKQGLGDRVIVRESIGDTVENAAISIGCLPAQIAKTMSFIIDGKPIVTSMAGDAKVDNQKFKGRFHQKAIMLPGDQVEALVGHIPGAVCPFTIKEGVPVYLDISLKRFETIYTAGESLNSTVTLSLDEFIKYSSFTEWVDICKGWYVND